MVLRDRKMFMNRVLPIKSRRSKGMITLVFYNNKVSQAFIDSFATNFSRIVY